MRYFSDFCLNLFPKFQTLQPLAPAVAAGRAKVPPLLELPAVVVVASKRLQTPGAQNRKNRWMTKLCR